MEKALFEKFAHDGKFQTEFSGFQTFAQSCQLMMHDAAIPMLNYFMKTKDLMSSEETKDLKKEWKVLEKRMKDAPQNEAVCKEVMELYKKQFEKVRENHKGEAQVYADGANEVAGQYASGNFDIPYGKSRSLMSRLTPDFLSSNNHDVRRDLDKYTFAQNAYWMETIERELSTPSSQKPVFVVPFSNVKDLMGKMLKSKVLNPNKNQKSIEIQRAEDIDELRLYQPESGMQLMEMTRFVFMFGLIIVVVLYVLYASGVISPKKNKEPLLPRFHSYGSLDGPYGRGSSSSGFSDPEANLVPDFGMSWKHLDCESDSDSDDDMDALEKGRYTHNTRNTRYTRF
jgi:hypothetical protein